MRRTYSQCQAVRDGCFSVTWVAAGPVKVLLGVRWFHVQVSANLAFVVDYLDVKKRDICGRCCLFKFDMWIKSVTMVKELCQFFFTVSPYEENVIYVSEPHERLIGDFS